MQDWLEPLFASIDARDTPRFLTFLTEDAVFRYGSGAPVVGRASIGAAIDAFFSGLRSCSHRLLRTWRDGDGFVCQGEVSYVLSDGRRVTLPFCNVFTLRGELISRYEIYIDPTPVSAR